MNIKEEIETLSDEADKPVLLWLFKRYHLMSQWTFVATFSVARYGNLSYQVHHIWSPTKEGRALYQCLQGIDV